MVDRNEDHQPQYNTLLTGHFREGESYAMRRGRGTQDYLLLQTVGGQGRFGWAGGEVVAGVGEVMLLAPGTPHDYGTAESHWELVWAHFLPRPHWHSWLRWPALSPGLMTLKLSDPVLRRKAEECLRETHRLATGAGRLRDAFAMNALEQTLLWCDASRPRTAQIDPRVQAAMDFLCGHMGKAVSIEDTAQAAGLSPSRMAHIFKMQTGVTPGQFLETQRLERARQLLSRTGLSVEAVAFDVGYDNPFYFTRRFRKATGQAPTEFRRAQENKAGEGDSPA